MNKLFLVLLIPVMLFGQKQQNYINNAWRAQEGDEMTGYPVFIETFHHKIHEGDAYIISGYNDLGSGDSLYFWLDVPASPDIHMVFEISASKITTLEVFRACDSIPKAATAFVPRNADQNQTKTTSLPCYVSTSISGVFPEASLGTKIDSTKTGSSGAAPSLQYGGQSGRSNEEILKNSTKYCYVVISGEASNTFDFYVPFYENVEKY